MKKIVSILLSVVLLLSVFSICVNADSAALTYTSSANIIVNSNCSLDPENFNIDLTIDHDKIGALDGNSTDFTFSINSITTPTGIDYLKDPEKFLELFTAEDFAGSAIDINFTVEFLSDAIFGDLEYTVVVSGFSAPLDTGSLGGMLGGSVDLGVKLPTDLTSTGTIDGIPKIDTSKVTIIGLPQKSDYYDYEKFDPNGIKLGLVLDNGKTGTYTYSEETANMFSFVPSTSGKLTVYDTEVAAFIAGIYVMSTPITVSHKWSDGYVNITTDKYTDNKPGYHAMVCEGCGDTHDAQPHKPQSEDWTYNNDQTFVANGTESNICADCGTVLTRDTFGTADFNTTFADMHFIKVIFEYINVLLRFIGTATY